MGSLILALRFLTIVPVPGREAAGPGALGRAGWWFPPVGLGLGLALAVADRLLAWLLPVSLAAVLVIALWKVLTGGLHLDGLADCLDGLGGRDPEERRAIMRDSRIGVFGAAGLALCLGLGAVALAESPAMWRSRVLVLAPALGRLAPLLAAAVLPPAPAGTGSAFVRHAPRAAAALHVALGAALGWVLLGVPGLGLLAAALAAGLGWSAWLARRLGGVSGDVLGGAVEVAELAALLAAASLGHLGGL
jgi:adenosylcobinamide-GDP ribazoletransferase